MTRDEMVGWHHRLNRLGLRLRHQAILQLSPGGRALSLGLGAARLWDAAVIWGLDWAGMSRMAQWMLPVSWEFSWGCQTECHPYVASLLVTLASHSLMTGFLE